MFFVGKYANGPLEIYFAYKEETLTIVKNLSFVEQYKVIKDFFINCETDLHLSCRFLEST